MRICLWICVSCSNLCGRGNVLVDMCGCENVFVDMSLVMSVGVRMYLWICGFCSNMCGCQNVFVDMFSSYECGVCD